VFQFHFKGSPLALTSARLHPLLPFVDVAAQSFKPSCHLLDCSIPRFDFILDVFKSIEPVGTLTEGKASSCASAKRHKGMEQPAADRTPRKTLWAQNETEKRGRSNRLQRVGAEVVPKLVDCDAFAFTHLSVKGALVVHGALLVYHFYEEPFIIILDLT